MIKSAPELEPKQDTASKKNYIQQPTIDADNVGITFTVHNEVKPATTRLPTCSCAEGLNAILAGESFTPVESTRVEACSDWDGEVVASVRCQALISAVHLAFSQHRPLILSPDMIWLTIAQGFANHIQNHPEEYRSLFVEHKGKETLTIQRDDFVQGSPNNPWPEVISMFSKAVKERVGPITDVLVADFSTTGPIERVASEIVMLEAFEPYFVYKMVCICGIPEITLEGTTEDWVRLKTKVECLQGYGLEWWLEHLFPICDHFISAAKGNADLGHWRDIFKLERQYGHDNINGWICKLIPYVKGRQKRFDRKNPLLLPDQESSDKITSSMLPSGLSRVPFIMEFRGAGKYPMEFHAGFVGVTQKTKSLHLRPKIGWAVRPEPAIEAVLCQWKEAAEFP